MTSTNSLNDESTRVESVTHQQESSSQPVRRSYQVTQPLACFKDYEVFNDLVVTSERNFVHFALMAESKFIEFSDGIQSERWLTAMKEEIDFIERNQTWTLVELRPIALKWVDKVKVNPKGEIVRYKARLVAKGFLQNAEVDYGDIYALVARMETVRIKVYM